MWRSACALAAALVFAGPVAADRAEPPRGTAQGVLSPAAFKVVTVRRGDTLYSVARREAVDLRGLIDANNARPPYLLRIGQKLRVPTGRRYVVARGDTLYGISRRFAVDLASLARLNGLGPPYRIAPGDTLQIPRARNGLSYVVSDDDTLYSISRRVGVSVASLAARNGVGASFTIYPGQILRLDARSGAPAATSRRTPSPRPSRGAPSRETSTASRSLATRPARPAPPPRTSGKFAWPVDGDVIATFGPKEQGLQNDGINIAAAKGVPVTAAESGVVVYAGDDLPAYGNLLLVKHGDGWLTAYAHLDAISVADGQEVARGAAIGRVGATGAVSRPQLHFETRRGSAAVDPLTQLPPRG